ncbi:MAG: hypothetical protein U9M89_02150 [Patescibacteria group bacterium]|nr:hypothetical protein [Patescibacteria group bacterium]
MVTDIENILFGTFEVSQTLINIQTEIVGDKNPIHRKGVIPFYMIEGIISSLIQDWSQKNNYKVEHPRVRIARSDICNQLRAGRKYNCIGSISHNTDEKSASIKCAVRNPGKPNDLLTFSMKIKHR